MSGEDFDIDGFASEGNDEKQANESTDTQSSSLFREVTNMCEGPDLIQLFGESGSGKSEFAIEMASSALGNSDNSVLIIDTERNVSDTGRVRNADYVYIPEWEDIYNFVLGNSAEINEESINRDGYTGKTFAGDYDVVILDSIGFPALVQYAKYRVDGDSDQFTVFLQLQAITGELKKYSQVNDCMCVITNQPKSDLSTESDPSPFGDKSIYGFKEVLKTHKVSSNEVSTNCKIEAFRSRQAGKGETMFKLEVTDSGTDIEAVDEDPSSGWV